MAGLLIAPPDAVSAELHRWAAEPFDIGLTNCGLSVLSYVAGVTGLAVPLWLRAFGRVGAGKLMRSDRRFTAVARRALAEMQCAETGSPVRGDVGLVRLPGGLTACICTKPAGPGFGEAMWAARGDGAAIVGPGTPVKAWRVACPKP